MNRDVQAVGLLLLLSFCAAFIIIGIVLMKTRLWDNDKTQKNSLSRHAGRLIVIVGAIVGTVSLMFFISLMLEL